MPDIVFMNKLKKYLKIFVAGSIIILTIVFFAREFHENIKSVNSFNLKFDLFPLIIAAFFIIFTKVFQTFEWFVFVNSISAQNKIKYFDAFTITNTSSLTKYLPGKIWEYALQMQWLGNHGFSKSSILYVNLFLLIFDYLTMLIISFFLWTVLNPFNNISLMIFLLVVFLLINLILLAFKKKMFNWLVGSLSKILKKQIGYYDISIKSILFVQGVHLLFVLSHGIAIYFICKGIGLNLSPDTIIVILPAFLIASLLGMIIVIMPGGLGVREGSMYLMTAALIPKSYALIIPIAIRIVQMTVEFGIGVFAVVLLKKSFNNLKRQNDNNSIVVE